MPLETEDEIAAEEEALSAMKEGKELPPEATKAAAEPPKEPPKPGSEPPKHEQNQVDEDEDFKKLRKGSAGYNAVISERERAKSARAESQKLAAQLKEFQTQQETYKKQQADELARAEQRYQQAMQLAQRSGQAPPPPPAKIPDKNEDPIGYLGHLENQLQQQAQQTQYVQRQIALDQFDRMGRAQYQDYDAAVGHLAGVLTSLLKEDYKVPDNFIPGLVAEELQRIITIGAGSGMQPHQSAYAAAKRFGYAPAAPGAPAIPGAPAVPGAPAPVPAADASKTLAELAKAQEAAKAAAGAAPRAGGTPTVKELNGMTEGEFQELMDETEKTQDPKLAWRKMAGG